MSRSEISCRICTIVTAAKCLSLLLIFKLAVSKYRASSIEEIVQWSNYSYESLQNCSTSLTRITDISLISLIVGGCNQKWVSRVDIQSPHFSWIIIQPLLPIYQYDNIIIEGPSAIVVKPKLSVEHL